MIDRETAQALVVEYLKSMKTHWKVDMAIIDESTVEKDYGWFFVCNSKEYAISRNPEDSVIGGALLFVSRDTGKVQPINYFSLAEAIANHEAQHLWGFEFVFYDLIIQEVQHRETALDYLEKLRLAKWKTRNLPSGLSIMGMKTYTRGELKERLLQLPCVFERQGIRRQFRILQQMDKDNSLIYKLVPSQDQRNPMQPA